MVMVELIWQWTPFMMLLLLAGLQSQPRDVLEAAGLADPLDHDLLDRIWESIVEAAVAWWQEHDDHTAEQMAQRLTRLLAAVTLRG